MEVTVVFDKNSSIGILDSGIGGYSVARRVQRLLPKENLIYFGDGAHIPYGNYSQERIIAMARYMFEFMEMRQVKALLVACNTISCVIDQCEDAVSCPTFNAVQAGADAVSALDVEKVGVISTVFTHKSRCYPQRILSRSPKKMVVLSCGCPDLARLVEHNLGNPAGMVHVEENLRQELDGMVLQDRIQCCILGCTHYPLVEDSIHKLYPELPLIDPAEEMALELERYLRTNELDKTEGEKGSLDIYTTGDVEEYAFRARQVGLDPVTSVCFYPPRKL
ncbi:MAG: aspartate/glutamate racemase family protein [Lawsonibacter sp.]|nr:aspartate/glutamate racemase family protein [Lawsonibacter sp.]